jgi:hypothetical protein
MATLTAERHPEGLIAPLLNKDWETALGVILHSPHYTKRVHSGEDSPLNVAICRGAPVEVVTALLEAYPNATTIRNRNHHNNLPCHYACLYGISSEGMKMLLRCNPNAADVANTYACLYGISSEGMKMLLRCNPNAADVANSGGMTPMQHLKLCRWQFFADEKKQVRKDLMQLPSYWKSKEQQDLLQCALEETDRRRSMRRSVARIILGRHLDSNDLVPLIIEYL